MGAPVAVPNDGAAAPSLIYALDNARVATKRELAAWIYEDLLWGDRRASGPLPVKTPTLGQVQFNQGL